MLNKVTVLDDNQRDRQRLPTDIQVVPSASETESVVEDKNEFFEVDLSDEEERREKKAMMTLRRNKTKRQNKIPE